MVATGQGGGGRGRGWPDLGKYPCGGGPCSLGVWVGDMGDDTVQWNIFWWIPPQVVPQVDRTEIRRGSNGKRVYPMLVEDMEEEGLQEVETYVPCL